MYRILAFFLTLTAVASSYDLSSNITFSPEPKQIIEEDIPEDSTIGKERFSWFNKYWMENPITNDYVIAMELKNIKYIKPRLSKLNSKYYELWDIELNNIYSLLLNRLNDNDKKLLIESQKSWLNYHINEDKFLLNSLKINKLKVQPLLFKSKKDRIKARTLELIWYYHLIADSYEYLYERELSSLDDNFNLKELSSSLKNRYSVFKIKDKRYLNEATGNKLDLQMEKDLSECRTTLASTVTVNKYLTLWDEELNKFYNNYIQSHSPSEKELLTAAQVEWISFKENESKFYAKVITPISGRSGTMHLIDLELTFNRRRTLELTEYSYLFNKK